MGNAREKRINLDKIEHLEALEDYVIVEAHEKEDITRGGIIIPDKAQKETFRGTVIAVGPGTTTMSGARIAIDVQIGDVLIYRNFQGWKTAEIDGKCYYAVSSEERFARIPKDKVVYE